MGDWKTDDRQDIIREAAKLIASAAWHFSEATRMAGSDDQYEQQDIGRTMLAEGIERALYSLCR